MGGVFSLAFAWIITDKTFNFFAEGDSYSYAYNYYYLSILDGRTNVPIKSIGLEGDCLQDGTAFMYYGVGPAFLRSVFHPFVDLSQTTVARFVVWFLVVASGLIAQSTYFYCLQQSQIRNGALLNASLWLGAIAIWLASPMLMLTVSASIYHEPIAFAFLFMTAFIWISIRLIHQSSSPARLCICAGLCAALALHGRPHVAISLYMATILFLAWAIKNDLRKPKHEAPNNKFGRL